MRTSDALRSSEVFDALQLVSEVTQSTLAGRGSAAVVAERLCNILKGRVCLIGKIPETILDVKMPWQPMAEFGWRDENQRHAIMSSLDDPTAADPMVLEILNREGEYRTFSRHELVADDGWYASRYVTKFRSVSGLDDQAFSIWSGLPKRGWMGIIGVHRSAGDPPFDATTVTLFELLHRQLAPTLWQADNAMVPQLSGLPPVSSLMPGSAQNGVNHGSGGLGRGLTPAQLRVLPYLLQGHREEKIAELLCRSRHTIHDHVMAIYREYGVHNRVELVLKFGGEAAAGGFPPGGGGGI
jgi:DNA-binding CsgD family transcriptional regulator